MATVNLSIVVPDAQLSRVQAAVRTTFGQVSDGLGGMRDMTNAELVERLRQDVILAVRGMVIRTERSAAITAAEGLSPVVDIT